MWQAVTSATSKLETLIQLLLKFNLQSQESQVESIQDLNFRLRNQTKLYLWDGDISWTVTSRGHYFSKWATFRGHSQRVTSRGHYFSKWVTSRGQF